MEKVVLFQVTLLKSVEELEELNRTAPKSKEITKSNAIERYGRHLKNQFLSKGQRAALRRMTLAQFVTYYDLRVTKKTTAAPIDDDFDEDDFEDEKEEEESMCSIY